MGGGVRPYLYCMIPAASIILAQYDTDEASYKEMFDFDLSLILVTGLVGFTLREYGM